MPSRMMDYEAIWTSDRLRSCKESIRHEYTWCYGLADAHGCFELNFHAIRSRVSPIRPKLSLARLHRIFDEFVAHGLLFVWISNGKRYGYWTNCDRPGRLPPEKERHRYKKTAPPVPKEGLAEYESRLRRDGVVSVSPLGVGVGLVLELDRLGDGGGSGSEALPALGEGAAATATEVSACAPQAVTEKRTPTIPTEGNSKIKNRTFGCDRCGERFADTAELMKHKCAAKVAAGWECMTCHGTFENIAALKNHKQKCRAQALSGARL